MVRCDDKSWSFLERGLGLILIFQEGPSNYYFLIRHWYKRSKSLEVMSKTT